MAVLVAAEDQDLFDGIILSSAGLEVDPQSAGSVLVSVDTYVLGKRVIVSM